MLRKFALALTGVVTVIFAASACSSNPNGQTISVGPTFSAQTLYATNTSQNGISIYGIGQTSGGPQYQIGGSSTTLSGPQYLTFDSGGDTYVTNYNPSTTAGSLIEIKAQATGNVLPYGSVSFGAAHPRGIAGLQQTFYGATTATSIFAVGVVDPSQPLAFASEIELLSQSSPLASAVYERIGGPATGLNVPSGVAADSANHIYVANLQGKSVTVYALPSPSPTPSPTATPSPTPSPTATPTGATPSPTPTPIATPTPNNYSPVATLTSGIGQPTGIALDSTGNIYVSDQRSTACACPAILVFPAGAGTNAPSRTISGSATMLLAPTDVKIDSSNNIYVADTTAAGAGVVYVFAAGASGNVAPKYTLTSPGTVLGIGLAP